MGLREPQLQSMIRSNRWPPAYPISAGSLDDKVPDHSTFSVNRHGRFRDSDLFRQVFEAVVRRLHGRPGWSGVRPLRSMPASWKQTPAVIMPRHPTRSTGHCRSVRRERLPSFLALSMTKIPTRIASCQRQSRRWTHARPGPSKPTSASASWLNAVEGFFAKLTRQRLKRGVFRSVIDLQVAINRFVAETNLDPKPFVWTADPKRVLAAVKRGKQTLESVH